jgi:hypothetical protein
LLLGSPQAGPVGDVHLPGEQRLEQLLPDHLERFFGGGHDTP